MKPISPLHRTCTSISVRKGSKRRLKAAVRILQRNGINWSESELLRQLAKLYLGLWRGRGKKAASGRRFSARSQGHSYVRVPWYIDKVLQAVLAEKAQHCGISVSRMLDFAIRFYASRLLEDVLRSPMPRHVFGARNASYWHRRWAKRRNPLPELFITYQCKTRENSSQRLCYEQSYTIYRKTGLSAGDILYLLRHAA